jgi:hypothetical protein
MKTVYVVGWEYDGGGGFDWYYTKEAADAEFENEKKNCNDKLLMAENWTAFRFDVEVPNYETATDDIDTKICELCDNATIKYKGTKSIS